MSMKFNHRFKRMPFGMGMTKATPRGFEPLRAEPNGFLVHHLNHSVTVSMLQLPQRIHSQRYALAAIVEYRSNYPKQRGSRKQRLLSIVCGQRCVKLKNDHLECVVTNHVNATRPFFLPVSSLSFQRRHQSVGTIRQSARHSINQSVNQ